MTKTNNIDQPTEIEISSDPNALSRESVQGLGRLATGTIEHEVAPGRRTVVIYTGQNISLSKETKRNALNPLPHTDRRSIHSGSNASTWRAMKSSMPKRWR